MTSLTPLLDETIAGIRPPDAGAIAEARARQDRLTKPRGSLGALEDVAVRLAGIAGRCPPPIPEPAAVAVFAADHGVHAQGVSPWPQEVTAQMVLNFVAGGAAINVLAAASGARVQVVDVGVASPLDDAPGLVRRAVRPGTADLTREPAMSRVEALATMETGVAMARDLVADGHACLVTGDMGIANTTASAALVAAFCATDPATVTGRGTGIDDVTWRRKVGAVRSALDLHAAVTARADEDPVAVLAAVGGLEHAAIAGLVLGAAALRVPVILDGVIAGSAALVASAVAPDSIGTCFAGHRSAEPGHTVAMRALGLEPLVDLGLRLGEGTGAVLALPLVQAAARVLRDMATFDSAGVTDKGTHG
ncbi:MAG: nicotinate-nucleotide--dimethylbenzimidazole phosphoribosyltransferase [Actinomycetales bacterium]|nr:nicotinate-nucleotide--dimethylbenzimidazole phosphoribosyltransferase [Actinomycetales bacterium]